METDILLAILLTDNSKNHEYFCHKYSPSKYIKEKLNFINKKYLDFHANNKFFNENLKFHIYMYGKQNLHDLNIISFFLTKKRV